MTAPPLPSYSVGPFVEIQEHECTSIVDLRRVIGGFRFEGSDEFSLSFGDEEDEDFNMVSAEVAAAEFRRILTLLNKFHEEAK